MLAGLHGSKIHDASFRRPASFKQFGSKQERRDGNCWGTPGVVMLTNIIIYIV